MAFSYSSPPKCFITSATVISLALSAPNIARNFGYFGMVLTLVSPVVNDLNEYAMPEVYSASLDGTSFPSSTTSSNVS